MTAIENTLALIERKQHVILPGRFDSRAARVMLIAIGLQESRLIHRIQLVGSPPRPVGPARGFWQFERAGVVGVMRHAASTRYAQAACVLESQAFEAHGIHQRFGTPQGDLLACAFARLLLWTDPRPLPGVHDVDGGWDYYICNWRPGRPHRQTWDAFHRQAVEATA